MCNFRHVPYIWGRSPPTQNKKKTSCTYNIMLFTHSQCVLMPRAVAARSNTGRHTESYLSGRMVWLREMNKSGGLFDQNVTDEGWHATKCTINVWTNLNAWKFLELLASVSAYHPPHSNTRTHARVPAHTRACPRAQTQFDPGPAAVALR